MDKIPVHPKNWLILFPVYEIILLPETKFPDSGKLRVESTFIIESPIDAVSVSFVLGVITKLPSTEDLPSLLT